MPSTGLARTENGFNQLGSRGYLKNDEWSMRGISEGTGYAEITIETPSGVVLGKIRSDIQNSIIQSVEFTIDEHGCADFKMTLNSLPPFPMFPFSIATIKIGNTRYNWYSGEISYKDDEKADDDPYEFSGVGLRNYLKTLKAQTTYEAGQDIGAIIQDLVTTWIVPYSPIQYNASKIKSTTGVIIANDIELSSASIETILNTLADMAACDWGVDGDKDLYFWPKSTTIKRTLFIGYDINTFKPKRNLTEVKNAIIVKRQEGAGSGGVGWSVAGIYNDVSSVKKYGRKEMTYQVPGFFEDEECDIVGNALLEEKKEPSLSATVTGYIVNGGGDYLERGNYRFVMPFKSYEYVYDDVDDIEDWETETGSALVLSKDEDIYMYGDGCLKIAYSGNNSDLITLQNSFELGKIEKINFYIRASKTGGFINVGIGSGAWNDYTASVDIPIQERFINFEWDVSDFDVRDIDTFGIQINDALGTSSTEIWIDRITFTVKGFQNYELEYKKATYKFSPSDHSARVEFGTIPPKMENYLAGLFAAADELKFTTEILSGTGGTSGGSSGGSSSSGVIDHGALTGLSDDDHPHYHNDDRGDARYALIDHDHDETGSAPDAHDHTETGELPITEDGIELSDVTTGDVSTSKHGFAPKAPNDTAKYLRGDGTWAAVPAGSGESIHDISADYTITDTDGYSIINVDPSARKVTVTLPTRADNLNRKIQIIVGTAGGDVVVDAEGVGTINGLASILLGGQYDNLTIIGCATEWRILSGRASIDTGWINTNDWTNRHLGTSQVAYDGKSGTFIIGETITEATSGNTGVITADSGTVLTLKNVTGTGIFTNDRQLTGGTSGATANVNEATSNKNKDTYVIHNFGYGIQRVRSHFYISEDKTEAKTYYLPSAPRWSGNTKQTIVWGVDTSQYKLQSGNGGISIINDDGTSKEIGNEDWYYKVISEVVW